MNGLRHVEVLALGRGGLGVLCPHHLLLEVDLGETVVLLAVLDLAVSLVDEVVAGSDVIVPVVFDALHRVLVVELVLLQQPPEQLLLHRHLLLAREQTHVTVPVLHLQGPRVGPDVVYCVSHLGIGI